MHKIPLTVISGFSGAGKTTLINHLSGQHRSSSIGTVVNPCNETGSDSQPDPDVAARVHLLNGIKQLLQRDGLCLDRLIVETPGLVAPGSVLQALFADPLVQARVDLDRVVTVVDALRLPRQMEDDLVIEQIAFADTLIINKCDLLDEPQLLLLIGRLQRVNRTARIIATRHARIQSAQIFDTF